ncbi:MAG: hypothetical protein MI861_06020 [Pirellulales bacterium]|nr:hypothetical protein [Pirellulales bacterium]
MQRPIVDPPPVIEKKETVKSGAQVQPVARVRLQAELVGTLVDHDYARAWIQLKGKRRMVKAGDVLDDHPGKPIVGLIEHRKVTVHLADQDHTLVLSRPKGVLELSNGHGKR